MNKKILLFFKKLSLLCSVLKVFVALKTCCPKVGIKSHFLFVLKTLARPSQIEPCPRSFCHQFWGFSPHFASKSHRIFSQSFPRLSQKVYWSKLMWMTFWSIFLFVYKSKVVWTAFWFIVGNCKNYVFQKLNYLQSTCK